jgi:hypothetical protein
MKHQPPPFRKICPLAGLLFFLLAGCAGHRVQLCGGRIHNASGRELRDIRIVHQPTGQMVMNNLLPAGGDIDLFFTDLELKATSATIAWEDGQGPRQATLVLPRHGGGSGLQRLVYEISQGGRAQARLIPCP